jgi:hypothetical protein
MVTVEPGCYIQTMDHVISADECETIEIQKKTMDWTGKLAELFGRANNEGHPGTPDQIKWRI